MYAGELKPFLRIFFDALWEHYRDDPELEDRIITTSLAATIEHGGSDLHLRWLRITTGRVLAGARPMPRETPPEHDDAANLAEHHRITKILFAAGMRHRMYAQRAQWSGVRVLPSMPESDIAVDALYRVAVNAIDTVARDLNDAQDRLDKHLYAACTGLLLGDVPAPEILTAAGFPTAEEFRAWVRRRPRTPTTNSQPTAAEQEPEIPNDAPPSET